MEHFHDCNKKLKVFLLRRSKWVLLEERNDTFAQIWYRSHAVPVEMLVMVVIPFIHEHFPASEECFEHFERREALLPLSYDKLREHLPSEFARIVAEHTDREASFSIGKSHYPSFNS